MPFRDVFVHCVVQDGEGRKMSKSLGNGVDPLDIIASHGADAMRFTVCNMSTNTQDVRLPVKKDSVTGKNTSDKFDLGRNFANKLWNAASFALRNLGGGATPSLSESSSEGPDRGANGHAGSSDPRLRAGTPSVSASRSIADRWMLSRLATAVVEVESALKNFEFSSYAQTMYDLLWRDFCDWYLEAIKPTVAQDASQRAVLAATLDCILRLLHPIMPYVTEAIYEQVRGLGAATPAGVTLGGGSKAGLLATAAWPKVDASLRDPAAEAEFEQLRAVITAIREVRAKHNVQPKRRPTLHVPKARLAHLRTNETLVSTLAGLGTITDQAPAAGSPFVDFTSEGAEYKLSDMADAVDAGAEKARLTKLVADLEKSVATFEGRLANPGYAAKAPPAMVQQTKDQMEKAKAELAAARKGLEGLA